jgi:dTDP-D-glucose 4,6-dehydratase
MLGFGPYPTDEVYGDLEGTDELFTEETPYGTELTVFSQ